MSAHAKKPGFWDMPEAPPDAAWSEKQRLASALRRAVALCVTSDAPEWTLSDATADVERAIDRLTAHPHRTFQQGIASCTTHTDFARFADRSTMTGRSNPFAPPMELSMDGLVAVANVTFGTPYEGIPGHVHGGMIAAAFDQLFGYLQTKHDKGSLTAELTVRYRKPTPLLEPLRFEASVTDVQGRRSTVTAKLHHQGTVTAEADAVFIAIDPARFNAVIAPKIET